MDTLVSVFIFKMVKMFLDNYECAYIEACWIIKSTFVAGTSYCIYMHSPKTLQTFLLPYPAGIQN